MRVALVTEGTYPVHSGGVGAWCHQLISGLPDIGFDVVALTGSGREPAAFTPPANVGTVQRIGLWAPPRRSRRWTRAARERFDDAYTLLLGAVLTPDSLAPARFETAIRELRALAEAGSLTSALTSQRCVDATLAAARRRPDLFGDEPFGLADALAVTDMIEHFLRPLELPAPTADLVHATANGAATLIGLLAKWEHGTPVILSEHGVYLRERMLELRRRSGRAATRAALIQFFFRLTELGYRTLDAVLPVSDFNGRWAVRCGAPPARVHTLYNGVDPAEFTPIETEPDEPTVVFAGRIDPLKDLATLLRAFALVRAELPAARLRLYGGTPAGGEGYAAACRALATELGLDGAATFEGPVSPVTAAFEAGHIVVLSSLSEGLPLTVIEAGMCGRATLGTDVGGLPEAIGKGGLVVPARDPRAFAQACVRLLTDHGERHELAEAGREQALQLFTLDRFLDDLRHIYTHGLTDSGPDADADGAAGSASDDAPDHAADVAAGGAAGGASGLAAGRAAEAGS